MHRSRLDRFAVLAVVVILGIVVAKGTTTSAAFLASVDNTGSSFSTIPDWKPPLVSQAAVIKAEGGIPGYVRASGSYRVVANIVDDPSSNPPAGLDTTSPTTNVSNLTTGATALTLTAGASTVFGQAYTHQSVAQTVAAGKTALTYTNSVTASDLVTPTPNSGTTNFSTVVDNTAPTRTSAAPANGNIVGRIDAGDTVTYTWSEIIDPNSVISGWTGTSTPVTVQIQNAGGANGDTVTIRTSDNSAQLPLGSIRLKQTNYVNAVTTFGGPANATRSTMTWNSTTGVFVVTLGPADQPTQVLPLGGGSGTGTANFEWIPQQVYDRAGNLSANAVTYLEPNPADREF